MKNKIILLFFILFSFNGFSSKQKLSDSLIHVINTSKNKDVVAANYILLGKSYFLSDLQKALECYNKAIASGYENNNDTIIAEGYSNKGTVFINKGDQAKALACLDSSMMYYKKIENKTGIATVLAYYGNLYYSVGDNTKSLQYLLACLKMREELNDKLGQAKIYNGIANIYLAQRDNEKALIWYRKSLDLNKITKNPNVEVTGLCNMGSVLVRQKKYDEAIINFNKAVLIADSSNNKDGLATAYLGLSDLSMEKGQHNNALLYLKKAEQLLFEIGNVYKINQLYIVMGDIYFRMGNYKESIDSYDLLLKNGKEMGMKQYQKYALSGLTKCYEKLNNTDKAYLYLSELTKLNDTLFKEEKIKQVAEMQTKFETERKEKENLILAGKLKVQELQLSNNRFLLFGLGILLILSVIIAMLVVRQNKLKSEQSSIQLEQKLLRSQMNPHFIFNSLTTIESFIYENQPKEAGRYLSDFARLMRLILDNSLEEYIPLNKEIKTLEYYLTLQKLRLEDNLTYNIKTECIEDIESIYIPPMLTQPFIENAIEHGFKGVEKGGHIDIEFRVINKNTLRVQVKDNGKGINNTLQNNNEKASKHKSMAVQITRERLLVLNKSKKQKVAFEISDLSEVAEKSTGTLVVFTIPVV